ncbi:MAG TPA: universal stress protein [Mycobacterium sp.]|uniref:universal stress protein n=1 Tax=Mycobacterium sp. TaxID=1785 RepID=UPI002D43FE37|nr:universal stress protein [Mycobacterium sp.]HXY66632.1 universal stress protein [Mycobacterium sp.]
MKPTERALPIVVGIDGSNAAINAARWAIDEAIGRAVPLRLVEVLRADEASSASGEDDHLAMQYAETALHTAHAAIRAGGRPVNVDTAIRRGDVDLILIEESRRAAMICVGSVGIGHAASRLLGSSAVALAKHAHCPVAIIRSDGEPSHGKQIVAVVDRYPDSDDVIHHALDEALLRKASVLALGVRRWKVGPISEHELDRRLGNWLPRYPDVAVHKCITDTATEYLVTRNEPIQLLVTGTADANKLTRLVGPHGYALAAYPDCSVLLVRH